MSVTRRSPGLYSPSQNHIDPGTIYTLPRPVLGGSVLFSSTDSRPGAGHSLALTLLRELARLAPRWNTPWDKDAFTISKSALGQPRIRLGDKEGPSLSFSHGEERLWAAMCSEGHVGIDVAYREEFAGGYPFARAFRPEELQWAGVFCRNDTARGAALIWSAKEAAVKATGVGFNLFDPLEVRVGRFRLGEQGILLEVLVDRPVAAWARKEDSGWLSIALAREGVPQEVAAYTSLTRPEAKPIKTKAQQNNPENYMQSL